MLGFVLINNDSPDINSVYASIFENVIRFNRKNNSNGDFVWDYWELGGQYAGFFTKIGVDKTFFDGNIASIPGVVKAYQDNPDTVCYPDVIIGGGLGQLSNTSGNLVHFLNNAKAIRVAAVEFLNMPLEPLCAA